MRLVLITFFSVFIISCNCSKTIIDKKARICTCEQKVSKSFFNTYPKVINSLNENFSNSLIYYCVVLSECKTRKGIYQFYENATHENTCNFYYFNGDDIIKLNNDNIRAFEETLKKDGFAARKIKKCFNKMNLIITNSEKRQFIW